MTLTLENIPDEVDRALRERAAAENKTVDATAIDALARGLDVNRPGQARKRDLTGIAGLRLISEEMKAAFEEQRRIDPELWK
jgi:plasmid stability protein